MALAVEDENPDKDRGDLKCAGQDDQGACDPSLEPAPQDSAERDAKNRLDRADDVGEMVAIPIADGADKHPIGERPEVRAGIVIVEREVQCEVQERRPRESDPCRAPDPEREGQTDPPDDERVIDGENRLPLRREVVLPENDVRRHVQQEKCRAGHQIQRQVRRGGPKDRGERDPRGVRPGKGRRADDQMGGGIQPPALTGSGKVTGHDGPVDFAPDELAHVARDPFPQFALQFGPHDVGHDIAQHIFIDLDIVGHI